jgi:hypothetical protein
MGLKEIELGFSGVLQRVRSSPSFSVQMRRLITIFDRIDTLLPVSLCSRNTSSPVSARNERLYSY